MSASVFILAFLTSIASYLLLSAWVDRRVRATALRRLAGQAPETAKARRAAGPALMQIVDEVGGRLATRLLDRLRLKEAAERLLETGGLKWGAAGLIHRSTGAFLAAFVLVTILAHNHEPVLAVLAGAGAAYLPVAYARRKADGRIRKFEEQFPDCLEFISRSMRAGHAFSVSLEMVYREFSDPLAGEFRRTFEEQNLGQPLEIVLKKLSNRIPSMDVQFFVSAVLLQKRTGGNLAELLDKLAHIIRERFKLRARVRAISAQGLMSGRILASIPLAVAALMFVVNRQYAMFFVDDPMGHKMVAGALTLLGIGYLIIRKIVTIEV
ncbi:MAG TPA: type II secretion system F family protein [Bryobacteraceae bacterium]|jgi:tight adherence protein B|nr:type II secretion system F family protein [Bryobacteraceae bacterium]